SAADRLADVLDPEQVDAVELGLSSDTEMAGMLPDLDRLPFLTNSDAHSLAKIGREYNALLLQEPSFEEFRKALNGEDHRRIEATYGLKPRLGTSQRAHCTSCGTTATSGAAVTGRCPDCGSLKVGGGVMDRIMQLGLAAGRTEPRIAPERPPYVYQVPL